MGHRDEQEGTALQLVVFTGDDGAPAVGVQLAAGVMPADRTDIRDLIEAGPAELQRLRRAAENPLELLQPRTILAPVSPRAQLLYPGGNYRDHMKEADLTPGQPVFFSKLRSAVTGPGQPIRIPSPRHRPTGKRSCASSSAEPPTVFPPSAPTSTSSATRSPTTSPPATSRPASPVR